MQSFANEATHHAGAGVSGRGGQGTCRVDRRIRQCIRHPAADRGCRGAAAVEERGNDGRTIDVACVPANAAAPSNRLDGARLRLGHRVSRARRAVIISIDTSALGRVYLGDQSDGTELSRIRYEGDRPVITSELTDVEIASALARATQDGVIDSVTADGCWIGTQPTPPISGPSASSLWTATPSRSRSG